MRPNHHAVILIADDDPDDCMLIERAFSEQSDGLVMTFVQNGEELLDYLNGRAAFADRKQFPKPDLILLDLNMPRMDGRTALYAIRNDPFHCSIPVVVLTTSQSQEDVTQCYRLAANSYISKPADYRGLVKIANEMKRYWLQTVRLPAA